MDQQAFNEMRETLVQLRLALASLRLSLLARKYDPNQPRAPGGGPDGGRWVSDGLGGADAAPPVSGGLLIESAWKPTDRIDLRLEELQGGHAIAKHVGKSDGQLISTLETEHLDLPDDTLFWSAEGSYSDIDSANKYTNDVLQ